MGILAGVDILVLTVNRQGRSYNKLFMESPSLTINKHAVEQVTSTKSLGSYVHHNINWECHIENFSKIACAIGPIKQIQHLTPFHILI